MRSKNIGTNMRFGKKENRIAWNDAKIAALHFRIRKTRKRCISAVNGDARNAYRILAQAPHKRAAKNDNKKTKSNEPAAAAAFTPLRQPLATAAFR